NVVLGPDGPCIVDFGIAWVDGAEPITQTGAWVGTPAWMPPERLAGDAVSPAGDVWSWGAVMGYAATGRAPAAGPTVEASAARARERRPRPGRPARLAGADGAGGARAPARRPPPRLRPVGDHARPGLPPAGPAGRRGQGGDPDRHGRGDRRGRADPGPARRGPGPDRRRRRPPRRRPPGAPVAGRARGRRRRRRGGRRRAAAGRDHPGRRARPRRRRPPAGAVDGAGGRPPPAAGLVLRPRGTGRDRGGR